jgi:iron-sulfur cluster assembly protein
MSNQFPVHFTQVAHANLWRYVENGTMPEPFVRIGMRGGACGGTFVLGFDTQTEHDETYVIEGIPVVIDRRELLFVLGTEIDFETRANGFYLHKPQTR